MLLVPCSRAALLKRLPSVPRAAVGEAAVRLRQEIVNQTLRHFSVQAPPSSCARPSSCMTRCSTYKMTCGVWRVTRRATAACENEGWTYAVYQLALRLVHLVELKAWEGGGEGWESHGMNMSLETSCTAHVTRHASHNGTWLSRSLRSASSFLTSCSSASIVCSCASHVARACWSSLCSDCSRFNCCSSSQLVCS
jgi:hypothetical protein